MLVRFFINKHNLSLPIINYNLYLLLEETSSLYFVLNENRRTKQNIENNSSLGEIGIHDRLKICSFFWGIGSSPIVSKIISRLI